MKSSKYCELILIFSIALLYGCNIANGLRNGKPIIGVLAQEIKTGFNNRSFIAASYVKAVEAAGARVVPIFINQTESYYREIMGYINGIVIPGGSAVFGIPGGFSEAVDTVYKISQEINDKEDGMFPILGVCQGMEIISFVANGGKTPLISCSSDNVNLPINFKKDFMKSRLYRDMSPEYVKIFSTEPVTSNHHLFCLTEQRMREEGMDKEWHVLSTNEDKFGVEFVSSMESNKYPFVGVQFHPEKPAYEWNPIQHNTHNYRAIYVNRYFYDWVVNFSKLNNHQFPDKTTEKKRLIYNYPLSYTPDGYDLLMYFFTKPDK